MMSHRATSMHESTNFFFSGGEIRYKIDRLFRDVAAYITESQNQRIELEQYQEPA